MILSGGSGIISSYGYTAYSKTFQNALEPCGADTGQKRYPACARPLPDAAFCSPLVRAKRTAELLLEGTGITPVIDERLVERDFGALDGKTYDELGLPDHTRLFYVLDEAIGAERSEDVYNRVRSFLDDIGARYDGKRVLVVSHGVCISYLAYALTHDRWNPADYTLEYIKNLDIIERTYAGGTKK